MGTLHKKSREANVDDQQRLLSLFLQGKHAVTKQIISATGGIPGDLFIQLVKPVRMGEGNPKSLRPKEVLCIEKDPHSVYPKRFHPV